MSQNKSQVKVLDALLSGASVQDAAQLASVSRRQVYRYLRQPGFVAQLRQAQGEHLNALGVRLGVLGQDALSVLCGVMNDAEQNAGVRRLAARDVLDFTLRFYELASYEARLAVVEEKLGLTS